MSRCTSPSCAHVWSRVVQALLEEQMKFALNAAVDVLPHNVNLHLWKKGMTHPVPYAMRSNCYILATYPE